MFGRLTVIGETVLGPRGHRQVICRCRCGNSKIVRIGHLIAGFVVSCGCYHKERQKAVPLRHGHARVGKVTPEFRAWQHMNARCYDRNDKRFKDYGARGIRVCKRWRKSFKNFLKDMGRRPGSDYSLGRKNNNKDYTPSNCRWETPIQQANNKTTSRVWTFNGNRFTVAAWSKITGISSSLLRARVDRLGWSVRRALLTI